MTYVVQRFASLAAFFYLLSLVMYIKGRLVIEKRDVTGGRLFSGPSLLFYLVSLISAVCSMKTKEIAFTLPLVTALYEFTSFKSPVKKRIIFLVLVLMTLIIIPMSILHSDRPIGEILSDVSERTRVQTQMSRWEYFVTQMRVIVTYLRLIFLPINQNLDYDYPIYRSLFDPAVAASFVLLAAILGAAVYLFYKSRLKVGGLRTKAIPSNLKPLSPYFFRHLLVLHNPLCRITHLKANGIGQLQNTKQHYG